MRVEVKREACEGHGMCLLAAPTMFEMDADDIAVVTMTEIPAEQEGEAEEAAMSCPQQAIALVR